MKDLSTSSTASFHHDFKLLAVTLMGKTNLIEISPTANSTMTTLELLSIVMRMEEQPCKNILKNLLTRPN